MKIRIIERNDGKFQYEFGYETGRIINHKPEIDWKRCEYMYFGCEESAKDHAFNVINFIKSAAVKRIVDELEI